MLLFNIMFFGFVFLSFCELFTNMRTQTKRALSIVIIFILLVLTTIRSGIAGDYETYKIAFEYMTNTSYIFAEGNFFYEPLYSLIQWLCKCIVPNFQFFLFVIGNIVIIAEYLYAKRFKPVASSECVRTIDSNGNILVKDEYIFTIFLILWGLYYANIFAIRSSIALVICLYITKYIEEKKLGKFIVGILIAMGFHSSAAIFVFSYFIYRFKSKLRTKLVIVVSIGFVLAKYLRNLAFLASTFLGSKVYDKINGYLNSESMMGVGTASSYNFYALVAKAVINMGFLLMIAIYLWNTYKNDSKYEGYLNLYLVGCVLYIATLTQGYAFARIAIYYNIFQIPIMIYLFTHKVVNRKVYWLIMVSYLYVRFLINLLGSNVVPFITIFSE